MDDGICAQTDPESFFPEKGGSTREAKAICGRCTVAAECLDYALDNQERFGIWGGLTDHERRKIAAALRPTDFPIQTEQEEEPATTNTVTPEKRITILKHLAGGKPAGVVATLVGMTEHDVVALAANHGYPDTKKMSWAVDVLTDNLEKEQAPAERPLAHGESTTPRPAPARPTFTQPAPPLPRPELTKPDEIRVLLNTAKDHPAKRIQTAANKVFDDIAKLRHLIAEDQAKNAERRRAEADKAAARAEVKRLEQQLADAKAKLRGSHTISTPEATSDAPAPSDIRAWAREKGLEVPAHGRVPRSITEAYVEAHPQAS